MGMKLFNLNKTVILQTTKTQHHRQKQPTDGGPIPIGSHPF